MTSDEALVEAIRSGRQPEARRAFDTLYRRYERRLFGYMLRILGNRARAEDLFQDVFMAVLEDTNLELREGRFGGWLFTVARNRCLTELRTVNRRAELQEEVEPPKPVESPETRVGQRQLLSAVFEKLSADHQDTLLLKEVGGLTYAEIAQMCAIPEGTVKSRLHFAIRTVRRLLEDER